MVKDHHLMRIYNISVIVQGIRGGGWGMEKDGRFRIMTMINCYTCENRPGENTPCGHLGSGGLSPDVFYLVAEP